MNRHRAAAAVIIGAAMLSACTTGGSANEPPQASKTATHASRLGTVGPVPAGQWVSAGPYEVRLDDATVTASASVPDIREPRQPVGVQSLERDQRLVVAWVSVRNSRTATGATLPAPGIDGMQLIDDKRELTQSQSVGLTRTDRPTQQDSRSLGTGEFISAPMNPGETFTFDVTFVVSASARHLTLARTLPTTPSVSTALLTIK